MKIKYEVIFDSICEERTWDKFTEEELNHLGNFINCQVQELAKKGSIKFRICQIE